jgi:hypothetical protein
MRPCGLSCLDLKYDRQSARPTRGNKTRTTIQVYRRTLSNGSGGPGLKSRLGPDILIEGPFKQMPGRCLQAGYGRVLSYLIQVISHPVNRRRVVTDRNTCMHPLLISDSSVNNMTGYWLDNRYLIRDGNRTFYLHQPSPSNLPTSGTATSFPKGKEAERLQKYN